MKHKVSELEGALLDAAVAKAEGWVLHAELKDWRLPPTPDDEVGELRAEPEFWKPSEYWEQAGPIIERERICIERSQGIWSARIADDDDWFKAAHQAGRAPEDGDTPLIAAMRAYVASKFGEEVELP